MAPSYAVPDNSKITGRANIVKYTNIGIEINRINRKKD